MIKGVTRFNCTLEATAEAAVEVVRRGLGPAEVLGHQFLAALNGLLATNGFDAFVEQFSASYYAETVDGPAFRRALSSGAFRRLFCGSEVAPIYLVAMRRQSVSR